MALPDRIGREALVNYAVSQIMLREERQGWDFYFGRYEKDLEKAKTEVGRGFDYRSLRIWSNPF
jgi:hypothetical protein